MFRPKTGSRLSVAHRLPEIDGLRGLAILYVVALHLSGYLKSRPAYAGSAVWDGPLGHVFQNGAAGVELFFVLSGFLIFRNFRRDATAPAGPGYLKKYYLRRLVRIEPPYFLALLLNFGLLVLVLPQNGNIAEAFRAQLPHLLSALAYCHNFIFPRDGVAMNIGVWSLEIEVQFYLLAPLLRPLLRCTARRRRTILASLFVLFVALNCTWHLPFPSLYNWLPHFLAGVMLTEAAGRGEPANGRSDLWLVPVGAALLALFLLRHHLQAEYAGSLSADSFRFQNKALYPLLIAGLCAVVIRSRLLRSLFRTRVLVWPGIMCYSIYLMHYPAISVAGSVAGRASAALGIPVPLPLMAGSILLAVLAGCGIWYRLVEKRFMKLRLVLQSRKAAR